MPIPQTRTRQELVEAIRDLHKLIDSAAVSHVVDGQSTAFDQDAARKRLGELENQLADLDGVRRPRPLFNTLSLSRGAQ